MAKPVSPPFKQSEHLHPLIGYILITFVSFRKIFYVYETPSLAPAILLLAAFTLLVATHPVLLRRFRWYGSLYLFLQLLLLEALGFLQPYEDTWALLYVVLGSQLRDSVPRRAVPFWAGAASVLLIVTMMVTLDVLPGLGFSLFALALTFFFFSYDLQYSQANEARDESQRLLSELQKAHSRLKEYASQAEALAAGHERERLSRELHDSVSQLIFSMTLAAESARIMHAQDPERLPEQIDHLQELTGRALAHMRFLISQWRPG